MASGGMMGEFEKIVQNESIVMTDSFADENGRAISAGRGRDVRRMAGKYPITFAFRTRRRRRPRSFSSTRNSGRDAERLRSRLVGVVR